jgi:hypothetical protein
MQARITTSANASGTRVRHVYRKPLGGMTAYFVETEQR